MATWKEFEKLAPEFAAFGVERFKTRVAYLANVRADGSPRVHPVTPIIDEHLFLFMEPTSPKGKELVRDPRYSMHCSVADSNGGEGEFYVRGRAALVTDPALREQATRASQYPPKDRYILFTFSIEFAFTNTYDDDGKSNPKRWEEKPSK